MAVIMFPGQGSQHEGMGKALCEAHAHARDRFSQADELLGFNLSKVMFEGSAEELLQTQVTQPAVFLNAITRFEISRDELEVNAVGGHSLGELTALVANGCLKFEDGLLLVSERAKAMQKACNDSQGTMAAILGMEDAQIEALCDDIDDVVVAANYNCPGQLVISGTKPGIQKAIEKAKELGARRALELNVNGAFHSPLMMPAQAALEAAIQSASFSEPIVPIYQNVSGKAETDPQVIKENLVSQLTSPVRWTQSMKQMLADGHNSFVECGAKVLSSFVKKIDRSLEVNQI